MGFQLAIEEARPGEVAVLNWRNGAETQSRLPICRAPHRRGGWTPVGSIVDSELAGTLHETLESIAATGSARSRAGGAGSKALRVSKADA